MAERIEHVRENVEGGNRVSTKQVIDSDGNEVEHEHEKTVAARLVWYVAGILIALLAFRFAFALLGANTGNAFANFIYTTSHPFVAPFFGLFSYNFRYGVSRFEIYTLIAIAVYALIAFAISRLITINHR